MAIALTEKAATEVKKIMKEQSFGDSYYLRVGISAGGCSGFSYELGFDEEYDEKQDAKLEQHGVSMVIDRKSALYLEGTVLSFEDGIQGRGFTFENPNAVKSCGCGSSFQA